MLVHTLAELVDLQFEHRLVLRVGDDDDNQREDPGYRCSVDGFQGSPFYLA